MGGLLDGLLDADGALVAEVLEVDDGLLVILILLQQLHREPLLLVLLAQVLLARNLEVEVDEVLLLAVPPPAVVGEGVLADLEQVELLFFG